MGESCFFAVNGAFAVVSLRQIKPISNMTYIDLINEFWRKKKTKPYSANEIALYLYLLDYCNSQYWTNPIEISTRTIQLDIGISHYTVLSVREKLKRRGLIDFVKGVGTRGAIYTIVGVEINSDIISDVQFSSNTVSNSAPNSASNPASNSASNSAPNADFSLLYKDNKTIKTNDVDDDDNKKRAKKVFPDIGQVIEYFKSTAAGRINDWQTAAELFFHTFNADGWVNRFGRPVANWRSEADKWIIYREQAEKRHKNNPRSYETKQRDRFSERRGTPPSTSCGEAFGDSL